jgi:hypothetical protein
MGLLNWLGFDGVQEMEPLAVDDKNFEGEILKSGCTAPAFIGIYYRGLRRFAPFFKTSSYAK